MNIKTCLKPPPRKTSKRIDELKSKPGPPFCPAIGRQYFWGLEGAQQHFYRMVLNLTNMQHLQSLKKFFLRNNPLEDNLILVLASRGFGMLQYDIRECKRLLETT